jgi:murein DD-endopeptidase MepM/ murein hydrolase activator NlpD
LGNGRVGQAVAMRKNDSFSTFFTRMIATAISIFLILGVPAVVLPALANESPSIEVSSLVWRVPLAPPVHLINQFRQPSSDYSAGHRGVDYQVSLGEAVFAPADGLVWFIGRVVNRNVVSLKHGSGILTEFEPVCSTLSPGETVAMGQVIGLVCDANASYRQHCPAARCLHFSLRFEGHYLSPLALIGGLNPSRLLPY